MRHAMLANKKARPALEENAEALQSVRRWPTRHDGQKQRHLKLLRQADQSNERGCHSRTVVVAPPKTHSMSGRLPAAQLAVQAPPFNHAATSSTVGVAMGCGSVLDKSPGTSSRARSSDSMG